MCCHAIQEQAQRREFAELLVKGEISPETFEEWNRETGNAKLPERVKKRPKKRKVKSKKRGQSSRSPTRRAKSRKVGRRRR